MTRVQCISGNPTGTSEAAKLARRIAVGALRIVAAIYTLGASEANRLCPYCRGKLTPLQSLLSEYCSQEHKAADGTEIQRRMIERLQSSASRLRSAQASESVLPPKLSIRVDPANEAGQPSTALVRAKRLTGPSWNRRSHTESANLHFRTHSDTRVWSRRT